MLREICFFYTNSKQIKKAKVYWNAKEKNILLVADSGYNAEIVCPGPLPPLMAACVIKLSVPKSLVHETMRLENLLSSHASKREVKRNHMLLVHNTVENFHVPSLDQITLLPVIRWGKKLISWVWDTEIRPQILPPMLSSESKSWAQATLLGPQIVIAPMVSSKLKLWVWQAEITPKILTALTPTLSSEL